MSQFDQALSELIALSGFVSARLDLAQAGGGNSSVKYGDGKMLIKASGIRLGDVTRESGWTEIPLPEPSRSDFARSVREWTGKCLREARPRRPSMEMSFHAPLDRVVLHLHPIVANAILCAKEPERILDRSFGNTGDYRLLPYQTPGTDVGETFWRNIWGTNGAQFPSVVLLKNHGIVITGRDASEVLDRCNSILKTFSSVFPRAVERSGPEFLNVAAAVGTAGLDLIRSAIPSANALAAFKPIGVKSDFVGCLFPDVAVLGSPEVVRWDGKSSRKLADAAQAHKRRWRRSPRIIDMGTVVVGLGGTRKQAEDAVEVWWAQDMILSLMEGIGEPDPLSEENIHALLVSEAEIYRESLAGEHP